MEEMLEQVEVRFDPQKSFAKMDKDQNMKNRIKGSSDELESPSGEEDLGRNQKQEIRGLEEHEDGTQQNHSFSHEEKIHQQSSSKELSFEVEEDDPLQDLGDGSQYTYLISIPEPPARQRLHPPSPFQQTSWAPWECGEDDSLLLHAGGLAVVSFSR